jgi:acetyl esterase
VSSQRRGREGLKPSAAVEVVALRLAEEPVAYRTKDVDYLTVEGRTFQTTIYQPEGPGPFPALLNVHGGQWTIATASRQTDAAIATFLARQGMVVAAVDFRQDMEHHYPDSVADVNYAMRWLRANAAQFNASPRPIGALGTSSGGHLVMLNSMRPDDPRYSAHPLPGVAAQDAGPDYVIGHSPILDPSGRRLFAERTGRDDIVRATDAYFQTRQALEEANPALILRRREPVRLAPALVIVGTADENIDYRLLEGLAEAYRAAGGLMELELFEGAGHVFVTRTAGSEDAERALRVMRDFIARQLAADGPLKPR